MSMYLAKKHIVNKRSYTVQNIAVTFGLQNEFLNCGCFDVLSNNSKWVVFFGTRKVAGSTE